MQQASLRDILSAGLLSGAALFIASGRAHAGMTLASNFELPGVAVYVSDSAGAISSSDQSGVWTGAAHSVSDGGAQAMLSAFSPTGFSLDASTGSSGNRGFGMSFAQGFTVDSVSEWRMTATGLAPLVAGSSANGGYVVLVYREGPGSGVFSVYEVDGMATGISSFDTVVTLTPGRDYELYYTAYADPMAGASSSFSIQMIPTPGAVAVLGLGALGARRRRR
ncbi:MAG: hypothetical protein RLY21_2666 [Planctomycetota bacterium]|jgi:MYXO-CTERM domain-containing protein